MDLHWVTPLLPACPPATNNATNTELQFHLQVPALSAVSVLHTFDCHSNGSSISQSRPAQLCPDTPGDNAVELMDSSPLRFSRPRPRNAKAGLALPPQGFGIVTAT